MIGWMPALLDPDTAVDSVRGPAATNGAGAEVVSSSGFRGPGARGWTPGGLPKNPTCR